MFNLLTMRFRTIVNLLWHGCNADKVSGLEFVKRQRQFWRMSATCWFCSFFTHLCFCVILNSISTWWVLHVSILWRNFTINLATFIFLQSYITSTMSKSPVTVQQWVDTLPPAQYTTPTPTYRPKPRTFLSRDMSLQSDDGSSHCSSVESVLELRKPDPEAVLLGLGFGPPPNTNKTGRIPQRFLQPSKVSWMLSQTPKAQGII